MAKQISKEKYQTLEQTARTIRWATLGLVALTFPYAASQATYVYILLGVAALFNACRYNRTLMRTRAFQSPLSLLLFDSLFVGLLAFLAGSISTPYSGLLVFIIVTGAYFYEAVGTIAVALFEVVLLGMVVQNTPFAPIELSAIALVGITMFVLVVLGLFVNRLTHQEKIELDTLEQLRTVSDQERKRLESLVNTLHNVIFMTDEKGKVLDYNEAARQLSGHTESLNGHKLTTILKLYRRIDPKQKPVDLIKDSSTTQHRRDLSFVNSKGETVDVDISVSLVQTANQANEYIIVCEDISQERSLDQQRTDFISVASHELRTPIAIIDASISTALSADDTIRQDTREVIEQAYRNTRHLADLVSDLTVLAEAQNDNIPVTVGRVDARDIVEECVHDFAAQIQQKGMKLHHEVQPHTPIVLSTEHHIREILQNYLTNALKYCSEGTISITAKPSKNHGILFSVADQGIGISPANQKLLFTKFFRAEDYRTRTTGGTGLGLYLTMELAKRLGARVWCESKLNEGSTFYLEVPPHSSLDRDQGEVVQAHVANLVEDI